MFNIEKKMESALLKDMDKPRRDAVNDEDHIPLIIDILQFM